MNERMNSWIVDRGEVGVTLSTLYSYWYSPPYPVTVVYMTVSPNTDDASATIDLNDDGTGVIEGVDASDADVPGTWKSTHVGGTNAPVRVAANSKMSLDANSAASGTAFHVQIDYLVGE